MIHYLLFSGHMIDRADRPQPRFPAGKEVAARKAIQQVLAEERQRLAGIALMGVAGGACGGDILFHEACLALDIPSELYLTYVPEHFKKTSVSFAGAAWEQRFDKLLKQCPWLLLPAPYVRKEPEIWEATNEWMMEKVMQQGGNQVSLIALWDGAGGDDLGGTAHMVQQAKQIGAAVKIIYTGDL